MKLYTSRGDEGVTDTLKGDRISKSDFLIDLIGTMDEFTSTVGMARACLKDEIAVEDLLFLQKEIVLFNAGVSGGTRSITTQKIKEIERLIDKYQKICGDFNGFILPGDNQGAAALDMARTIARRAERIAVRLMQENRLERETLTYMNRLSDLMFAIARYVDYREKIKDVVIKVVDRMQNESRIGSDPLGLLNLETAKRLAVEIEKKAMERGMKIVVAITDEGGNLILLHRMEDAFIASIDIAVNKAYTCVALKMTTEQVGKLSQPGSSLYGLQYTNNNRIVIFGGGVPLTLGERVVGGLGISGGTAEQDTELAEYGAEIFGRRL